MDYTPNRRQTILICFLLAAVTVATYWPVFQNSFIKLDDHQYVTENPHVISGLKAENVKWAFKAGYASNWHPLTWISHMLDVQIFGLNPRAHHSVNLLLHICNAILLFLFLQRTTHFPWRSAMVAALFAIHPLHVESVAWVAERKDVLSTFFLLLTLLTYGRYARSKQCSVSSIRSSARGSGDQKSSLVSRDKNQKLWLFYTLALLCFALGLMSKPMLVTTPFLLLLLDSWPLNRVRLERSKLSVPDSKLAFLILEKLPFLALGLASSAITFLAQDKGHAVSLGLPFGPRLANAIASYVKYLGKTIWPTKLAIFYPHPDVRYPISNQWPDWAIGLAALLLVGISIFAFLRLKHEPWFATGWFWFLGTLVPVIGIVQVGGQAMADRYTYVPLIGIFICLVWALAQVLTRPPLPRLQPALLGGACVIGCAVMSHAQVKYWRNSTTLFEHTLAVTSNNAVAHYILGTELAEKGEKDLALKHLEQTVEIDPSFADAYFSMGYLLAAKGRNEEAIKQYQAALRVHPWHAFSHNALGAMLWQQGKLDEAQAEYSEALRLNPDFADAHFNLGMALSSKGQLPEAEAQFEDVVRLQPTDANALSRLAETLVKQGKWPEAEARARELIRVAPADPAAHLHLGEVLERFGKLDEARQQYAEAIHLKADLAEAHFLLGKLLVRLTNFAMATSELQEAIRRRPNYKQARLELGRALAAQGKSTDATEQFKEVIRLDPTDSQACLTLALSLMSSGQTNDAITWFSRAEELNPGLSKQYVGEGKMLVSKGEMEAAMARFDIASKLDPTNDEAHENLGLLLAGQGKLPQAVTEFEAAIAAKPTAEAYHHLGLARLMQGKPQPALTNYRKAVELKPDWTTGLNDLAWVLATNPDASVRNGTEAVKLAEHACAINGKEPRYWGTLDAAYAELGRFPDAITTAEKVKAMAAAQGDTNLAQAAEQRLALYRKNQPFRQ